MTMNNMAGEQFYEKKHRVSFSVKFRVRVSDSVSVVVNIMFEIPSYEVPLALSLHTPQWAIHRASSVCTLPTMGYVGLALCLHTGNGYTVVYSLVRKIIMMKFVVKVFLVTSR